jgi:hypothetical protein
MISTFPGRMVQDIKAERFAALLIKSTISLFNSFARCSKNSVGIVTRTVNVNSVLVVMIIYSKKGRGVAR